MLPEGGMSLGTGGHRLDVGPAVREILGQVREEGDVELVVRAVGGPRAVVPLPREARAGRGQSRTRE